jgi:hypothetical protein
MPPPPPLAPVAPQAVGKDGWRYDVWHGSGSEDRVPGPPPSIPTLDPLLPTGIAIAVPALVVAGAGIAMLEAGRSSSQACGLSGCFELRNARAEDDGVAVIASGAGVALVGGLVALAGARGTMQARRSNARMVVGVAFTALGVGMAFGSVARQLRPYSTDSYPPTTYSGYGTSAYAPYDPDSTLGPALAVVALACLGVGIPLWATGARSPEGLRVETARRGKLDVLPAAGGASLRWTQ